MNMLLPPVWLIIFIVGLPQLSESVYSPTLPQIALFLSTSESMVELSLTLYLVGFGVGSLFFGCLSDYTGRKPALITGIFLFILGSILCYQSSSINMLLLSRFIQAFGGSVGSVLGQAICRDAFKGNDLGKIYASVGSALALFPAIGPIVGTIIADFSHWQGIFLFLILMGFLLILSTSFYLPETLHVKKMGAPFGTVFNRLKIDTHVIKYGFLVGGCNGLAFSYYAEGPFFFKEILSLSDYLYGYSFFFLAGCNMLGALYNKKCLSVSSQDDLIALALKIIILSCVVFGLIVFINLHPHILITASMICVGVIFFCIPIVTGNALSMSLKEYKDSIGTASSIFGCFYYIIISLATFGMASCHSGTLFSMPFYFLSLSIVMMIIFRPYKTNL